MTASAWKTSAGAAARVPVALAPNLTRALEEYRKAGFFILGLDMDGEVELPELQLATEPLVIVVGSEGKGLSRLVSETCDQIVSIPMSSAVESSTPGSPPASRCTRSPASAPADAARRDHAAYDEGPVLVDRALARSLATAARDYFVVVTTTVFMTLSAQVCLLASQSGHSQPIGRPQAVEEPGRARTPSVPIGSRSPREQRDDLRPTSGPCRP